MLKNELIEVLKDKNNKHILVRGPVGLGKTTAVSEIIENEKNYIYRNCKLESEDLFDRSFLNENNDKIIDIRDALRLRYPNLGGLFDRIVFIFDDFTADNSVMNLLKNRSDNTDSPIMIFITDDVVWAGEHSDLFDTAVEARPISFMEYLDIIGKNWYAQIITGHLSVRKNIPGVIHDELIEIFDRFLITGGDPRAVYACANDAKISVLEEMCEERYERLLGLIIASKKNYSEYWRYVNTVMNMGEFAARGRFISACIGPGQKREQTEPVLKELSDKKIIYTLKDMNSPKTTAVGMWDSGIYYYLLRKSKRFEKREQLWADTVMNYARQQLMGIGEQTQKPLVWSNGSRYCIPAVIKIGSGYVPIISDIKGRLRATLINRFSNEFECLKPITVSEQNFNEKSHINVPYYACDILKTVIPQQ